MAKSTKSILSIVVTVLLVGGAGALIYMLVSNRSAGVKAYTGVPSLLVTKGPFEKTVNSIGELRASKSSIITSPYEGQIVKLVEEGTAVSQGDPVVWLSTTTNEDNLKDEEPILALAQKDLEAAKEQYRLQELQNEYSLKSQEAKVELAQGKLKDAEQKFETEKILVDRRISARSQLDEAQLAMLQAGVELRSARINLQKEQENMASTMRVKQTGIDKAQLAVEKSERRIEEFKKRIEDGTLRAPANGEVSYFKVYKNGTSSKVAEGDTVWDRLNLVEIPDRSQMIAIVPVNELDIALVEAGQPVSILLDAIPNRVFAGTVNRKSIVPIDNAQMSRRGPSTTQSQGPREFEVTINLTDTEPFFFQGMTASVRIQVAHIDDALQAPLESLSLKGEEVGVYRASGNGAEFVPVKVINLNETSSVVEGNLKAGDMVYLRNPLLELSESREQGFEALRRVRRVLDAATEAKAKLESAGQRRGRDGRREGGAPTGTGDATGGPGARLGEGATMAPAAGGVPGANGQGFNGPGDTSRRRRAQKDGETTGAPAGGQQPAHPPANAPAQPAATDAAKPATAPPGGAEAAKPKSGS